MITYLKCIWWNKAMLFAYLLIIAAILSIIIGNKSDKDYTPLFALSFVLSLVIGIIILLLCGFGIHTINQYDRVLYRLHQHGDYTLNHNSAYCYKAAHRWAYYEYKKSLKPKRYIKFGSFSIKI